MLEPEALGGVGILGLLGESLLLVVLVDPVAGLLVGVALELRLLLLLGERIEVVLVIELVVVLVIHVGGGALNGTEVVVVLVLLIALVIGLVVIVLALQGGPGGDGARSLAGGEILRGRGLVGAEDRG